MDRLADFMSGFAAAHELLHRAFSNGFLVEVVVLSAAVIDGCLRIGLILQYQIETKSANVLEDLLYQGADDRGFSERQVYRRARETGVIDEDLFRELDDLYDQRNRVVHRYIISDLTTHEMFKIARRYELALPKVNEAISVLEQRQIQLAVGMTRDAEGEPNHNEIRNMADAKHGAEWLARGLRKRST